MMWKVFWALLESKGERIIDLNARIREEQNDEDFGKDHSKVELIINRGYIGAENMQEDDRSNISTGTSRKFRLSKLELKKFGDVKNWMDFGANLRKSMMTDITLEISFNIWFSQWNLNQQLGLSWEFSSNGWGLWKGSGAADKQVFF